jgi:SAM-dependent methyltransferase
VTGGAPQDQSQLACPLCAGLAQTRIWTVAAEEILVRLSREWGASISGDALPVPPDATFALYECGTCGLHFFVPALAGDAAFYQQLMAAIPYETSQSRWEFGQVARELRPTDRVVDFGCGDGAFLRMAKPLVRQAVGVDRNSDAIEQLRHAGLTGEETSCSEFAQRHPEGFDIACAFHTLEHVAEISEFIKAVVCCVRPGGRIFLSVPNRRRVARENGEPLDCPPHHVSRWDPAQWLVLAIRFGLDLRGVRFQEPDLSHVNLLYRQDLDRRCWRLLRRPAPALVLRAYAKLLVGPRRHEKRARRGWYSRRGIYGHAMLAEFVRPSP